jgi:hypothetical protein
MPRQLPAATPLAGRRAELQALTALLDDRAEADAAVLILVIGGAAGTGKTALAAEWARQVAERFPGGQLHVDLRGSDAAAAMPPGQALRGFLEAFEVPARRIPADLDAQAALYRSVLAGRRVLVLLDNARDSEQVRPLLPGSPGSLVVVTSRNQLTSLAAAEGAHLLNLDLPPGTEAGELLRLRQGTAGASPARPASRHPPAGRRPSGVG